MKKTVSLILLALLILGGCAENNKNNLYFSIRTRPHMRTNNTYDDYLFTSVEAEGSHERKDYGEVNLYTGYSSGLVDADQNLIYYIDRRIIDDENSYIHGGDELYSYNIKTKESKQLTEGLGGNNYVFKNKDTVYLVSSASGIHGQQLFAYDIQSGALENVGPGEEYNVRIVNYNPITDEIILSVYRESEVDEALENQSEDKLGYFVHPSNYIYSYKDGVLNYLFETGSGEVRAIVANTDYVVYYFEPDKHNTETLNKGYYTYDRKSGSIEDGMIHHYDMSELDSVYYISEDNSYIYCSYSGYLVKHEFETGDKEKILNYASTDLQYDTEIVLLKHE